MDGLAPYRNVLNSHGAGDTIAGEAWQSGTVRKITVELYRQIKKEELAKLRAELGDAAFEAGNFERAAELLDRITTAEKFETFLTLPAYAEID
jgi:malate synthase